MNIVELISGQLGKDVVGRLGSLIGESGDKTSSAVGAAVPALLAGFTNLASKPEGAVALESAINKQDGGLLGNLAGMLGNSGNALSQQGGSLLTSLLGNNMLSGLIGSLGNFLGLGQNSVKGLLGVLTPVILGVLGKQKSSLGLDAGGLANLLSSQKQNIMGAMPAGLGSALGSVSGLGSFLSGAGSAAGAAYDSAKAGVQQAAGSAANAARAGVDEVTHTAARAGSSAARWIIPIVILALLAFFISRMIGNRSGRTGPGGEQIGQTIAAQAAQFTTDLKGVTASAAEALGSVKDAASASAAVPKLRELNTRLDGLKPVWDKIPADLRSPISALAKSALATIAQWSDKLKAIPGVGDTLKPALDEMNAKLTAFAS